MSCLICFDVFLLVTMAPGLTKTSWLRNCFFVRKTSQLKKNSCNLTWASDTQQQNMRVGIIFTSEPFKKNEKTLEKMQQKIPPWHRYPSASCLVQWDQPPPKQRLPKIPSCLRWDLSASAPLRGRDPFRSAFHVGFSDVMLLRKLLKLLNLQVFRDFEGIPPL